MTSTGSTSILAGVAAALTDQALAERLDLLAQAPRTFTREERDAFTAEAGRRLRQAAAQVHAPAELVSASSVGSELRDGARYVRVHLNRGARLLTPRQARAIAASILAAADGATALADCNGETVEDGFPMDRLEAGAAGLKVILRVASSPAGAPAPIARAAELLEARLVEAGVIR